MSAWMTYVPWGLAAVSLMVTIWLAFAIAGRVRTDKRFSEHEVRLNKHDETLGTLQGAVGELRGRMETGVLTVTDAPATPPVTSGSLPG